MPRGFYRMRLNCFRDSKFFSSSNPLAPIPLPSPKETHLWYVIPNEVKGESLLNKYMEILSPCEKEHVLSMRGDELRKSALLARTLVRTTIARYQINSSIQPRSLKFRKSIHGKPEVDWQHCDHYEPPLHFNISHTSSLIACGVTINSPIGIDVEAKQRPVKHNVLTLARRYFTEHELHVLAAIEDPHLQHQEFIKLWTLKQYKASECCLNIMHFYHLKNAKDAWKGLRDSARYGAYLIIKGKAKEAYVKALGRGFSGAPFKTFTVRFGSAFGESPHISRNSNTESSEISVDMFDDPSDLTSNWQFMLLELAGSHYAAICTEKDVPSKGNKNDPMKLTVWKTIPFVEDACVSGTDAVHVLCGFR